MLDPKFIIRSWQKTCSEVPTKVGRICVNPKYDIIYTEFRFLMENGADVSMQNSDGELPSDLVETELMRDLVLKEMRKRGIDEDQAKHREENMMMADAMAMLENPPKEWPQDPKSGAYPLHVAAAKGYIKVMK